MKVLHSIGNFPIPPHGGMETVVYRLSGELASLGVDTKVVAAASVPLQIVDRGCEYIGLPVGTLSNWIRLPRWSGVRTLQRLVRWADIVHVHNPPELFNVAVVELAFRAGRPVVLSMLSPGALGNHPRTLFRWIGRADDRFQQWAMRRAAFTQVKCRLDLPYVQRFTDRTAVIPDGVASNVLAAPRVGEAFRMRQGLLDSTPVLLYLGRLHPMKGPDQLIRALPHLFPRFPEVSAVLAGPDPDGMGPALRRLAESIGVSDRVRIVGTLDEATKIEALDAADVVVLPTRADFAEGFSIVASEAWARGKPVAAYPAGALKVRVVQGENGALADSSTPPALAEAVVRAAGIVQVTVPTDVVQWGDVARRFLAIYQAIQRETSALGGPPPSARISAPV